MRRIATACLLVGLLTTAGLPVAAQDEDLRMGDDPAYFERIEVPEAGVAVSFPADWDVTVEMEYRQHEPGDPYSGYWSVARGSDDPSDASCSLDWELFPGPSMLEIAGYEEELRDSGDLDEDSFDLPLFDVSAVELPAGAAVRELFDDALSGNHFAAYEIDHGGTRYSLSCYAETPPSDEWLDIAETIELLPAEERLDLPLEPPSEPRVTLATRAYELERMELPEVGIAMQLPAGWELEVMAEERELPLPPDYLDGAPMPFLQALYTEGPLGDWCSLQIHSETTLDVHEHGDLQAAIWSTDAPVEMHVANTLDFLADDLARHVDIISETNPGIARAHIIDVGPVRHVLTCGSSIGVSRSWRDMANAIELLEDVTEPGPDPEPEALPDEEPDGEEHDDDDLTDADAHGLERFEFAEAGVSLALPPDWSVELLLEEREDSLPSAFADAGPITFWALLHADAPDGEWCELSSHPHNPMPLHDHASWDLAQWSTAFPDLSAELYSAEDLGRERLIVVISGDGTDSGANLYFFESAGERYQLDCTGVFGPDSPWDAIAASVEPLDAPPDPEPLASDVDVQHSDVDAHLRWIGQPRAGVSLTLPDTWHVVPMDVGLSVALPPPYDDHGEIALWRTLEASLEDRSCRVYAYEDMPMSLEEHAAWLESQVPREYGTPGAPEVEQVASVERIESVELPIGPSMRLIAQSQFASYVDVIYLFDVDGRRRALACSGPSLPSKAWLSTARSLQPIDGLPTGTVAVSELQGIETILPVTEPDYETYMHASCERALWIEFADGVFEERLDCRLTDEPVGSGNRQGTLPSEWSAWAGGACEWVSDFWAETDGSEVWASSWSVTLEPDGTATAISRYAPEELDCES